MIDERRVRMRVSRAGWVMTRMAGLVTASVLASGCGLLPSGGGASKAERALVPDIHEVAANPAPACIATEDISDIADARPLAPPAVLPIALPAVPAVTAPVR